MGAARFIRDLAVLIGAGRAADSFATSVPTDFDPIVLGGCGRSGTTLLQDDARFAPAHLLRAGIEPVPAARRRHALARRTLRLRPRRGARDLRCGRLAPGLHRGLRRALHAKGGQGALGREDAAQHQPHRRDLPLLSGGALRARAARRPRRRLLAPDPSAPQGRGWQARADRHQEADRGMRPALGAGHREFAPLVGRPALHDGALRGPGAEPETGARSA